MQRFIVFALAAGLAGGAAFIPAAHAQSYNNQGQPTATGNAWMNENDYDYNRNHWTPPNNGSQYQRQYNSQYERNGNGQYSSQYDRNGQDYQRGYSDGTNDRRSSTDNRYNYDQGYRNGYGNYNNNGNYNNGYGRNPSNYDNEDDQ